MTLDLTKPAMTRDGQPVEIITTKGRYPEFPIVGYIGSSEYLELWALDGSNRTARFVASAFAGADLVNVPEPKRVVDFWVNVYPNNFDSYRPLSYLSKDAADQCVRENRIACVHVRWIEGKGAEVIND